MKLRITHVDGSVELLELGEKDVTIGRSLEVDLVLDDEKASRMHCVVRNEDGTWYIKDLQSKNGTFVNGLRVESKALSHGDRIRIGSTVAVFEEVETTGANTALMEVEEKMSQGKGYRTILKEIVNDAEDKP